jgi:hypothetical protein
MHFRFVGGITRTKQDTTSYIPVQTCSTTVEAMFDFFTRNNARLVTG